MLDMDTGRKDVYVRPTENWGLYYVIFCIYTIYRISKVCLPAWFDVREYA